MECTAVARGIKIATQKVKQTFVVFEQRQMHRILQQSNSRGKQGEAVSRNLNNEAASGGNACLNRVRDSPGIHARYGFAMRLNINGTVVCFHYVMQEIRALDENF